MQNRRHRVAHNTEGNNNFVCSGSSQTVGYGKGIMVGGERITTIKFCVRSRGDEKILRHTK